MRRTTVQVAEIGAGLAAAVSRRVAAPTDFRAVFRSRVDTFHKAVTAVDFVLILRPVAGIAGFSGLVISPGNVFLKDISGTGVAFAFFIQTAARFAHAVIRVVARNISLAGIAAVGKIFVVIGAVVFRDVKLVGTGGLVIAFLNTNIVIRNVIISAAAVRCIGDETNGSKLIFLP